MRFLHLSWKRGTRARLPVEPLLVPVVDLECDENADYHQDDFAQGVLQVTTERG